MEENKNFELSDEELNDVAGGTVYYPEYKDSIEFNGVVYRVGDRLYITSGPCNNCGRSAYGKAVSLMDHSGSYYVNIIMECCGYRFNAPLYHFAKA